KSFRVNTVYTVYKKLDSLVKLSKDKVPKGEKTEVVYQIECMDCDACYISQTKRHLNTRIREHQLDIRKKESSWSVVSIVPRMPLMNQMYSIHTRYMNVGISMIFVLCESRSSNMYRAIWKRIVELVPMLQQNLKFIMSDYEIAAMKVINEQFPAAEARGCWFHFNQVF
ncbi:hypothetical protein X777_03728, partial [Ooceraea biroi]